MNPYWNDPIWQLLQQCNSITACRSHSRSKDSQKVDLEQSSHAKTHVIRNSQLRAACELSTWAEYVATFSILSELYDMYVFIYHTISLNLYALAPSFPLVARQEKDIQDVVKPFCPARRSTWENWDNFVDWFCIFWGGKFIIDCSMYYVYTQLFQNCCIYNQDEDRKSVV